MKKVLVINGPNLNLLGTRDPHIYGKMTYDELEKYLKNEGSKYGMQVATFQSNSEGSIIDKIHEASNKYDCIILNAGAYSHYSIAIRDAILSINIPVIEVHISNIYAREEFRSKSVISPVCTGIICGFGIESYIIALNAVSTLTKK